MTDPEAPGGGLNLRRVQPRVLRTEVLTALRTAILANEIWEIANGQLTITSVSE